MSFIAAFFFFYTYLFVRVREREGGSGERKGEIPSIHWNILQTATVTIRTKARSQSFLWVCPKGAEAKHLGHCEPFSPGTNGAG